MKFVSLTRAGFIALTLAFSAAAHAEDVIGESFGISEEIFNIIGEPGAWQRGGTRIGSGTGVETGCCCGYNRTNGNHTETTVCCSDSYYGRDSNGNRSCTPLVNSCPATPPTNGNFGLAGNCTLPQVQVPKTPAPTPPGEGAGNGQDVKPVKPAPPPKKVKPRRRRR